MSWNVAIDRFVRSPAIRGEITPVEIKGFGLISAQAAEDTFINAHIAILLNV
jgi:hypothetical protein